MSNPTPDPSPEQPTPSPDQAWSNPGTPHPYPYPYPPVQPPRHPQALTILILGLVSFFVFWPLGFVAYFLGRKPSREVKENPTQYSGGDFIMVGKIFGILGMIFTVLFTIFVVFVFGFAAKETKDAINHQGKLSESSTMSDEQAGQEMMNLMGWLAYPGINESAPKGEVYWADDVNPDIPGDQSGFLLFRDGAAMSVRVDPLLRDVYTGMVEEAGYTVKEDKGGALATYDLTPQIAGVQGWIAASMIGNEGETPSFAWEDDGDPNTPGDQPALILIHEDGTTAEMSNLDPAQKDEIMGMIESTYGTLVSETVD